MKRYDLVFAVLVIIAFFITGSPVAAAVMTIDDIQSIQTAIDTLQTTSPDASDTLILNPGIYTEHDIVVKKNIVIRANTTYGGTAASTTIDAGNAGRIFYNNGGFDHTIDNLTMRNGQSTFGGAIYNSGTLTITGSRIFDCSATLPGGGAISTVGTVNIIGSTISGCSATNGGAIYQNGGGTVTITGSTITGCSAHYGGAFFDLGAPLIITGSTITGCTAAIGGAVYQDTGSSLSVTGTTFDTCTATNAGGAINAVTGTTMTIDQSSFLRCTATNSGGAVFVRQSDSVTIGSSTFSGCRAGNGGAIHAGDSIVTITTGTRFLDCIATNKGGAIEADSGLRITSATFSNCLSEDGGAIYYQNGAIPATALTIRSSVFTGGNGVSVQGGAIFNDAGTVSIRDTTFSGYRAATGGAIYNDEGAITVRSSGFSDCGAEYGGAIFNDGSLDISTTTFFSCTASGDGGAIASRFNRDVTIDQSLFMDCLASQAGGALRGLTGSTYTITSSGFTGCRATTSGAIHTDEVNMVSSRLYDNGASVVTSSSGDVNNNWWGRNSGPAPGEVTGPDYTRWVMLGITANPDTLTAGQAAYVPANLTYNSRGEYLDPSVGYAPLPDDILVLFTVTSGTGTVRPMFGGTVAGINTTSYTSDSGTVAMVNATVDGESVGVWINVNGAAFTGSPLSGTPPLAVHFTDASVGSPTMWNWSFGDGSWFNTTDAAEASPSHTYTGNGIYTVSLTVTGAFGTHTLTRPGYVVVSTNSPAPAATQETWGILSDFPSTTVLPTQTGAGTLPLMTVIVNIGGDSKAWQAVVTGTKLSDLIVTGTVQAGPGFNMTAPPGTVFQYISIVPARFATISHATINFSVPQSWLDENHIDPKNIVLYHQTANGWEALPTTVLSTKDGTVYFSAESSGFSLFAIAGTPGSAGTPAAAATQQIVSIPAELQTPAPPAKAPVTTETTAPPAPVQAPAQSSPFPLVPVVAVLCCAGLIGGGWYARRWWIRKQNPALFAEYD